MWEDAAGNLFHLELSGRGMDVAIFRRNIQIPNKNDRLCGVERSDMLPQRGIPSNPILVNRRLGRVPRIRHIYGNEVERRELVGYVPAACGLGVGCGRKTLRDCEWSELGMHRDARRAGRARIDAEDCVLDLYRFRKA